MPGGSPAHVTLSPNEDFVAVANYAGSLSLFPLYDNGTVAPETFYEAFPNGSHVVMDTQATGHVHNTRWLPNSNHVVAANLGGDDLLQYELDATAQTLTSLETVYRPPGSEPRHTVLGSGGEYLYVSNEISNAVGVYKIDQQEALLESPAIQNITTIPANFTNASTAAGTQREVHLRVEPRPQLHRHVRNRRGRRHSDPAGLGEHARPNATRLYGLRRLTHRGEPELERHVRFQGRRFFNYLCYYNRETGLLSYTGNSYEIEAAVCLYVSGVRVRQD